MASSNGDSYSKSKGLSFRILEIETEKRSYIAGIDDPILMALNDIAIPFLRIYGYFPENPSCKVVCNVHHVFPYVLVKCDTRDVSTALSRIPILASQLEAALAESFRKRFLGETSRENNRDSTRENKRDSTSRDSTSRDSTSRDSTSRDSTRQPTSSSHIHKKQSFIYKVVMCHGTDFYGYHAKPELFYKILLLEPSSLGVALNILGNSELCLGKKHKTFNASKAHIPFMLQVMVDYNLFGMDWLHLSHYRIRSRSKVSLTSATTNMMESINDLSEFSEPPFSKNADLEANTWNIVEPSISCDSCLEIDTFGFAIVNRQLFAKLRQKMKRSTLDGVKGDFGTSMCVVPSLENIWKEEQSRCLALGISPPAWSIKNDSVRDRNVGGSLTSSSDETCNAKSGENHEKHPFGREIPSLFNSIEAAYPRLLEIPGGTNQSGILLNLVKDEFAGVSDTQLAVFSQLQRHQETKEDELSFPFDPSIEHDFYDQFMLPSDYSEKSMVNDEDEEFPEGNTEFTNNVDVDDTDLDLIAAICNGKDVDPSLLQKAIDANQILENERLKEQAAQEKVASEARRKKLLKLSKKRDLRKRYSQNNMIDLLNLGGKRRNDEDETLIDNLTLLSPPRKRLRCDFENIGEGESLPMASEILCPSPSKPSNQSRCSLKGTLWYKIKPPSLATVMQETIILPMNRPFFSNPEDSKRYAKPIERYREKDGPARLIANESLSLTRAFDPPVSRSYMVLHASQNRWKQPFQSFTISQTNNNHSVWLEYLFHPPKYDDLPRDKRKLSRNRNFSQVDTLTPSDSNPHRFLLSQKESLSQNLMDGSEFSGLTLLSVEIICSRRENLLPDPSKDPVEMICVSLCVEGKEPKFLNALFVNQSFLPLRPFRYCGNLDEIWYEATEIKMLEAFTRFVIDKDPDIIMSYDLSHRASLGYLCVRVASIYERNLEVELGRIRNSRNVKFDIKRDDWGHKKWTGIHIRGRICIPVWKVMRGELTGLRNYSREEVTYHVVHERIGKPSFVSCIAAFADDSKTPNNEGCQVWQEKMDYLVFITCLNRRLLLHPSLNVLSKGIQFSLTFGTPLFSTLTRGSQFKVESMMARVCLMDDFVLLSATSEDVRGMEAAVGLPLIMEPVSGFYTRPILVFDFQSLYPSIMIAYNYCFSTIVKKKVSGNNGKLGFAQMTLDSQQYQDLGPDDMELAPNGVYYVKKEVRRGVLCRLLTEILQTRVMIKNAMKRHEYEKIKTLRRRLDSTQLSLKFISNVTYGYTSASFSGRMPNVHVADSIVMKGREILERTRVEIEKSFPLCSVKYGDTDSLFVMLDRPGLPMQEYMRIGDAIAKHITLSVRSPMKLKFEKVYMPSVLLAKKRYTGLKFEAGKVDGVFEAKGLETVRRDACPLTAKMMEKCLMTLYRTLDLSLVKQYLEREFEKIMTGRIPLQDYMFCKEVKMANYGGDEGEIGVRRNLPAAAHVQARLQGKDPMNVSCHAERIPYLVTYSLAKETRLVDCVISPMEYYREPWKFRINVKYYMEKAIVRPLNRIFGMIGVDLADWQRDMSLRDYCNHQMERYGPHLAPKTRKSVSKTLDQFCASVQCFLCEITQKSNNSHVICLDCRRRIRSDPISAQKMAFYLGTLIRQIESQTLALFHIQRETCRTHGSATRNICNNYFSSQLFYCGDWNCPYLYEGLKTHARLMYVRKVEKDFLAIYF